MTNGRVAAAAGAAAPSAHSQAVPTLQNGRSLEVRVLVDDDDVVVDADVLQQRG